MAFLFRLFPVFVLILEPIQFVLPLKTELSNLAIRELSNESRFFASMVLKSNTAFLYPAFSRAFLT